MPSILQARKVAGSLAVAALLGSCSADPSAAPDRSSSETSSRVSTPTPTPRPACTAGTRALGMHDTYVAGRRQKALLCAVDDLPSSSPESTPGSPHHLPGATGGAIVQARISGPVQALVQAATAEGVSLRVNSSFRSHPRQQQLCEANAACASGDHRLVAPPGYSNHQSGLALDFAGTTVTGSRSCGSGRASDPDSSVWRFLNANAERFGLRQYAAESWHWEAVRRDSACPPLASGSSTDR